MPSEKHPKAKSVESLRHAEYYDMQRTFDELYTRSQAREVFDNLMELILSKDNIMLAYRNIKSNSGSATPGTDRLRITDIGRLPADEVVARVRKIVRGGINGYTPRSVRRKEIPKPNGKTRPLGIPCIWDRLIQQCIKQVMEPICEAKFSSNSYGFRPNRSVENAIAAIYRLMQRSGLYYVVEFDVKGFFDNVDHSKLIRQLWSMNIRDPDKWVIDEEAASVVREIFQMCVDGKGPYEIARCLAERKVERPSYYLAKRGLGNHQSDCDYSNPYTWRGHTVATILERPEYTGCTVNFRTYKNSYKDKKIKKADKSDWVIFEGTQEPIIDKETWSIVQNLRKHTRRTDSLGEANPLTGKVFCGECGSLMYNHRRKNGRVRVYYTSKGERRESYSKPEDCYACSKHILTRQTYKAACSGHHIRTSALRSIVLECIRKTCSYVQSNPEEFLELYNQISESQNQSHLRELRSRITKAEHRTKDIDALIRKIYEDNIAGRLSDKMLENLLEGYEKEKNELEEEQKDCQQQLDSAEKQADNTNHFIELAKKYTDFSELTPAMVNEFVSKIIVHRPFELNGTRAVQVEVYLNYIGKFDVPEEPMILSEEELATQKIREEKLEKHRIASRKYMAKYRKRLKEMKKAGTILPENLPAETKGEWL